MAMRRHDRESMPLCLQCHHDLHNLSGLFKGWNRDELRTWQEAHVQSTLYRLRGFAPGDATDEVTTGDDF